jgi:peptide/nickel transport system permease protein
MAILVGGAVITESVFIIQGLGHIALTGVNAQDIPVTMGVILIGACAVVIMGLLADIAYAYVDPRVKLA